MVIHKYKRFYIFITCPEGATINWGDDSDESNIKKKESTAVKIAFNCITNNFILFPDYH